MQIRNLSLLFNDKIEDILTNDAALYQQLILLELLFICKRKQSPIIDNIFLKALLSLI